MIYDIYDVYIYMILRSCFEHCATTCMCALLMQVFATRKVSLIVKKTDVSPRASDFFFQYQCLTYKFYVCVAYFSSERFEAGDEKW